jgi:hypothetical protein
MAGASHHVSMLDVWNITNEFLNRDFYFANTRLEKHLVASIGDDYSLDDYDSSLNPTREFITEIKPDAIVSDNLVGILKDYPESVLMGSFLWADVLRAKSSPEVERICDYEDSLLIEKKPLMLGLSDMAMQGVKAKTDFVGLPWFCSRNSTERKQSNSISVLVTGGGTGQATESLLGVVDALEQSGKFQIFLDKTLHSMGGKRFSLFDFEPETFSSLQWIICRPGIGILTDAVKYEIPVCALQDDDLEMKHNANRVRELGIGISLPKSEVYKIADTLVQPTNRFIEALMARKTGGAQIAARYILDRIN